MLFFTLSPWKLFTIILKKDDDFSRIPILKVVLKEINKGMHNSATDASIYS